MDNSQLIEQSEDTSFQRQKKLTDVQSSSSYSRSPLLTSFKF